MRATKPLSSPLVSVVIPTSGRRQLLERCLQAIFEQTLPAKDYEVIVVDDGSRDGTTDFLRSFQPPGTLRLISQTNRGAAVARNAGVSMARGTFIVFLDDDIVADSDLLKAHVAMLTRHPEAVVVGRIDVVPAGFDHRVSKTYESLQRRVDADRCPGARLGAHELLTGNCSIARAQFEAVGGFDERLRSNEDLELGLRLMARGVPIRWCPEASAQEWYSRGVELFLDDAWYRGRAHALITRAHPEVARRLPLARFYSGGPHRRLARSIAWSLGVALSKGPYPLLRPGGAIARLARLPVARRLIAAVSYWGGVRSALESRRALRRAVERRLLILGYHIVDESVPGPLRPYAIRPHQFAAQMAYLDRSGFRTVSLESWIRFLEGRGTVPERPVVISIDDGDRRTVERVPPILAQHGFSGTLFVVAGALGSLNDWESEGFPRRDLVGVGELRDLADEGWEVGCHGMKHRRLPDVSERERTEETEHARAVLTNALGGEIRFFAYPYGNVDRASATAVRLAGFAGACGSLPGVNHPDRNRYRMRRVFVSGEDGPWRFAMKIRFARWHFVPLARRLATGAFGRLRSALR